MIQKTSKVLHLVAKAFLILALYATYHEVTSSHQQGSYIDLVFISIFGQPQAMLFCIGLTIAFVASLIYWGDRFIDPKIEKNGKNTKTVVAQINQVRIEKGEYGGNDNHDYYIINATWKNLESNQTLIFESDWLIKDPTPYLDVKMVEVVFNIKEPNEYSMLFKNIPKKLWLISD